MRRMVMALAVASLAHAPAARADDDVLLDAMETELRRAMEGLAQEPEPPYFMAYEVIDTRSVEMHGEDGALGSCSDARVRQFDVDVRVGDPSLDNTHPAADLDDMGNELRRSEYFLPVDDDPRALRAALWKETERRYRNAVSRLIRVRADRVVRQDAEELADFSAAPAVEVLEPPAVLELDREEWAERLRLASAPFRDSAVVYDGSVRLSASAETRTFVSSEGTRLRTSHQHWRVAIEVATLAPEGTPLSLQHTWDASDASRLPTAEQMRDRAEEMERMLVALTEAPEAEPWSGPAILSGSAAAVFFHEIFGHRMEGHRLRDDSEGHTFADQVGQQVLPAFLDVVDDPTLARLQGVDLNGHYTHDDEGVPAQRVVLVDDGVLKRFLTSRMPIPGQDASNGHGRRQSAHDVISRQGNLVVEAADPVSTAELRRMLLREVEAQGAPYGLLFEDITGGFTYTGRSMANSFNVSPVVVYRVYADGRPDELVRGVDLIGTPLATFGQIIAAGEEVEVFNGYCGAESGWVPVSAVAPDLLVRQIEVQRKETGDARPPILPPPGVAGDGQAAGEVSP